MKMNETESKSEDTNQNTIILEETFYVLTKKNAVFRVQLTRKGLCLIKESETNVKEQMIAIKDIIGCKSLRSKKQTSCACSTIPRTSLKVVEENSEEQDDSDVSAYLYIYAYILQNSKRERTIITLRFRSFDKYEDNNKEAQKWRTAVKRLIRGENVNSMSITDLTDTSNKFKENRRLLILLNPKSGPGKSRVTFQQKVAPLLQEAEIPYDLHITKYSNYAREFVRKCNIFQWSAVVVVGGDGLLFEVINGMFERWDWSEVCQKVPVAIIPGGSGNGLARSIAHIYCEPYFPSPSLSATFGIIHNNPVPMDLVRIETTTQILFSFLSVGWGFISDIDIQSESLRVLGSQRFTIWSIARLIGLRSYGGTLWYLPITAPIAASEVTTPVETNVELPSEMHFETQTGRQRLDSWYSVASKRSTYFSTTDSSYQSTTDSMADPGYNAEKPRMYGPASQVPCLTASLPSTWKCIKGRFVLVHASYQTHLGEECYFAPNSKLNDGIIWLLIVRDGASRSQMLNFLLGLSSGAHATNNSSGPIELIAVRGFRIEPDMSEQGCLTVDGELVEYGAIQAEIFPALVNVLVP